MQLGRDPPGGSRPRPLLFYWPGPTENTVPGDGGAPGGPPRPARRGGFAPGTGNNFCPGGETRGDGGAALPVVRRASGGATLWGATSLTRRLRAYTMLPNPSFRGPGGAVGIRPFFNGKTDCHVGPAALLAMTDYGAVGCRMR